VKRVVIITQVDEGGPTQPQFLEREFIGKVQEHEGVSLIYSETYDPRDPISARLDKAIGRDR
jgi:hypothetical protein